MIARHGLWIAAAWAGGCIAAFLANDPIPFGTGRIPPFPTPALLTPYFLGHAARHSFLVALFWLAAWRAGAWLLRLMRRDGLERDERVLVEAGLGAGALGLAAFGLGFAGALSASLLRALLGGLALAALPAMARGARGTRWREVVVPARATVGLETAVPLAALAAAAAYQFLIALGPTLFYDSLVYHLALPDLYLRRGALVAAPMNVYAGIPAGVEMLYVWLLALGDKGTSCQLLHLSLGLLTVVAIVLIARRLGRTAAGAWAAAVFFLNPMVLLESGRPAVELGWSFYLALTLLVLIAGLWRKGWGEALLVGTLAGLALGTKYQAALLLPAVLVYFLHRVGGREGAWAAFKVCLVAVAVAAPWGLKNIFYYRNPVFPMLGGTLFAGSELVDLPAFISSAHGRSPLKLLSGWDSLRTFLSHPWTYALPLETSEADNVMSLAYLCALPLLVFRADPAARSLLLVAAVLWLPMNLLSGLARFNIPALAPLSLAVGFSLHSLERRRMAAAAAAALGGCVFALSLLYAHSKTDALLWRVLTGDIPVKTYLSHRRPIYPTPPFPAFEWIDANVAPGAKVLLVGEPRAFYLERDYETSSPYAAQPVAAYAGGAASGDDLYRRLRAAGFTHVCLNLAGMSLSRQTMSMSPEALKVLEDFWTRSLTAMFVDSSDDPRDQRFSVVYRILDEEERARPHSPVQFPFARP